MSTARRGTRRQVFGSGARLGGALVAGATIGGLLRLPWPRMGVALAAGGGDAAIVRRAAIRERALVVVYDSAASEERLDEDTRALAGLFRDQEQEHSDALGSLLLERELAPPQPPRRGDVDGLESALSNGRDFLSFALRLESAGVRAYHDSTRTLEDAVALRTSAAIMANHGQHLAVLRRMLNNVPVPTAFERGEH